MRTRLHRLTLAVLTAAATVLVTPVGQAPAAPRAVTPYATRPAATIRAGLATSTGSRIAVAVGSNARSVRITYQLGSATKTTTLNLAGGTATTVLPAGSGSVRAQALATSTLRASSLLTVPRDTTAPAAVANLRTTNRTTSALALSWTNPAAWDLRTVVIRRNPGTTAPSTPTSGTGITPSTPRASSLTSFGLAPDTTYSFAVFTRDVLGNTSTAARLTARTVALAVTRVSAGRAHTCALLNNGTVKCWGGNGYGQLGNGATNTSSATPVTVAGVTTAIDISAGAGHTCAVLSGGTVKCWGHNGTGELGNGSTRDSATPVTVAGLTNATRVTAGGYHTCALIRDGSVKCWGRNESGQVGNNVTSGDDPVTAPWHVTGLTNARSVSALLEGTCALRSDGTFRCWGQNGYGQLGNTRTGTPAFTTRTDIAGATALDAGDAHTCALLNGGTAACWGWNGYGQLGNGTTTTSGTAAALVGGLVGATAISAGGTHTCVLISGGTVKCWGNNTAGQLGDRTNSNESTPVTALGISNVTGISAGGAHTCALLTSGAVTCWGSNGAGQLGGGTTSGPRSSPVVVTGISDASTSPSACATCARSGPAAPSPAGATTHTANSPTARTFRVPHRCS